MPVLVVRVVLVVPLTRGLDAQGGRSTSFTALRVCVCACVLVCV